MGSNFEPKEPNLEALLKMEAKVTLDQNDLMCAYFGPLVLIDGKWSMVGYGIRFTNELDGSICIRHGLYIDGFFRQG